MSGAASEPIPTALDDRLARCIRCGLCLPACPTYDVFRTEMDGPRGRLMLMREVWEQPEPPPAAVEHLDLCLGCLSCETACPSGVEYGSLLRATRDRLAATRSRWGPARWLSRLGLAALGNRFLLHLVSAVIAAKQALGIVAIGRRLPLPGLLGRALQLLPETVTRFRPEAPVLPAEGERVGSVALFRGCVQDAFLGKVNAATARVLCRRGFDVHLPAGQTCCGAAARHAGEIDLARRMARRNLAAFDLENAGRVVSNAGGCGAMLAEYPELFAPGSTERERAERLAASVCDLSEVLDDVAVKATEATRSACHVVYADSCHLRHAQGVVEPPRKVLRATAGVALSELARPDHCCGSAGTYNLTQGETADRLLAAKLEEIRASGAEVVVTSNPGCQLQIGSGVRRAGLGVEVLHLAELLDRAEGGPKRKAERGAATD